MTETRFPGPAGLLEGFLYIPEGAGPFPGVVVCHPHSLMGGNMDNNVVMGICHVLARLGIASLRFNFRGVGRSESAFDEGRGEIDDALEAIRVLASSDGIDASRVGLAGYSFGAGVAMKAALRDDISRALALIGRARVDPDEDLNLRPSLPILFAVGDRDRLMPQGQIEEISARLTTKPEMHVLPGADHFLAGREMEVGELVAAFFQRWLRPQSQ
ncbi:MAG: dienelactone hydrolase family protein [Chloroflexi bacterium]|nr:dienelactone hydrolase family protein [Chloroflexota bacterium]